MNIVAMKLKEEIMTEDMAANHPDLKVKEENVKEEVATSNDQSHGGTLSNINSLVLPPGPMDNPFMQQQSQIFVFSTAMANNAADAVSHEQFKSIRDFHMAQPKTKQLLQKLSMNKDTGQKLKIEAWVAQQNDNLKIGSYDYSDHQGPNASNFPLPNRLPNDTRTPEQLQTREDKLASLRKLHQMLLSDPTNPSGPSGPGPGGEMPGPPAAQGPMMSSLPHSISGPPGMASQAGAIMAGPGHMLPPPGSSPFGPRPPNFENPAQREWYKLQHEFFLEKRRKENAERFWYFQQMQSGPGPMAQFPPGPRPPNPDQFNDMGFFPQMQPGGGPIGPFPGSVNRAGNPEHLGPDGMHPGGLANKPPPPYTQSNKRKRSPSDNVEEPHKRLQPAPSPKQFSTLTQFEGQELTITKQLNTAYQDCPPPATTVSSSSAAPLADVSSPRPGNVVSRPSSVSAVNVPGQATVNDSSDRVPLGHPNAIDSVAPSPKVSSPLPNSRPSSVSTGTAPTQQTATENLDRKPVPPVNDNVDKSPQVSSNNDFKGSPGFSRPSSNSMGNANVQIQAKAPNTIQYMPAPQSSAPGPPNPRSRKDMDMSAMARLGAPSPMMGPKSKGPFMAGNGPMMSELGVPRMPGPNMLGGPNVGPNVGPYGPVPMQPGMMHSGPMMSQPMPSYPYGHGNPAMGKEMEAMPRFAGPGGPQMLPKKAFPGNNGPMMMEFGGPRMAGPAMMGPTMSPHGPMGMQPGMMPNSPMMSQQPMGHFHYNPPFPN